MSSTVCRIGVLLLVVLAGSVAADEPAKRDADLAYVPADATVFVSVRVADVLASGQIQKLMAAFEKVSEARRDNPLRDLKEIEDRIGLKLSDVESVTFVGANLGRDELWFVIRTKKDIDKDKVVAVMKRSDEMTFKGKTYYRQQKNDISFHLANARTALFAPSRGVERYLELTGNERPPSALAPAVELARTNRYHVVAAADLWNALPLEVHEKLTRERRRSRTEADAAELVLSIRTLRGTARLGETLEAQITAEFRNPAAAQRATAIMGELHAQALREFKHMLEEFPERAIFQGLLDGLKPVRDGNTVSLKATMDTSAVADALVDAIPKARESGNLKRTQDCLHNIGQGMHEHVSGNQDRFPTAGIRDKNGKPLLSWRVALLPELEGNALYRQFKLDEAWDSPHNIKLLERMPKIYEAPYLPAAKAGHTYYQVFTGPDTVFPVQGPAARSGSSMFQITASDGASNTVLVCTAAKAVPWTAPEDLVLDKDAIKPKLHWGSRGGVVLMCDGSVHMLPATVKEKTLRSAIMLGDDEILGDDWYSKPRRDDRDRKDKKEK